MANKNYYKFISMVDSTEVTLDASTTFNHCTFFMEQCKIDPIKTTLQSTKVQYGAAYHSFTAGTRKIKCTVCIAGTKNYVEALLKNFRGIIAPGRGYTFIVHAGNDYSINGYTVSSIDLLLQNPTMVRLSFQMECPFPLFNGPTYSGASSSADGLLVASDSHKDSEISLSCKSMGSSTAITTNGGELRWTSYSGEQIGIVYNFPSPITMYEPELIYDSSEQTIKLSYSTEYRAVPIEVDLKPYIDLSTFERLPRIKLGSQHFKWIPDGDSSMIVYSYTYNFQYAEVPRYWF